MNSPLLADLLLRAAARGLVSDEDGRRVAEYVEGLERVVAVAQELRAWGVELDESGMSYLVVQVPRVTRDDFDAALRALPEPPGGEGR